MVTLASTPIMRGGGGLDYGVKNWMITGNKEAVRKAQKWNRLRAPPTEWEAEYNSNFLKDMFKDWEWYECPKCLTAI